MRQIILLLLILQLPALAKVTPYRETLNRQAMMRNYRAQERQAKAQETYIRQQKAQYTWNLHAQQRQELSNR